MIDLGTADASVDADRRDGVDGVDGQPSIVSVSDVHGYLGAARSALKTPGDHPEFDPLVSTDGEGRLHWAGGDDYVLVFNGDLVDRGPDSEGVIAVVERLADEAPSGHVRATLGNHEWGVLFPDLVQWREWYSGSRTDDDRLELCRAAADGHLVAAYGGYNFTYAHAGQPSDYRPSYLNERLIEAADRLSAAVGTDEDRDVQASLVDEYRRVLGLGRQGGRGFGAGIAWLDFRFLPPDSQPQVVGHTRQEQPVQKSNVICENVIRANQSNAGGEAVLVETPDRLVSLERTYDGDVHTHEFELPEGGESE